MSRQKKSNQITDFLGFANNLWAILAQASVLFPYSNQFFDIIPVPAISAVHPFYFFPPALVPLVATLYSAFMVLVTFVNRAHHACTQRQFAIRRSKTCFVLGILALLAYFGFQQINVGWEMCKIDLCGDDYWRLKQVLKFALDAILVLSYSLFFGMITRAFMVLAMITYHDGRSSN